MVQSPLLTSSNIDLDFGIFGISTGIQANGVYGEGVSWWAEADFAMGSTRDQSQGGGEQGGIWKWGDPSADALTLQGFKERKVSLWSRQLRGFASFLGQITTFSWAAVFHL